MTAGNFTLSRKSHALEESSPIKAVYPTMSENMMATSYRDASGIQLRICIIVTPDELAFPIFPEIQARTLTP